MKIFKESVTFIRKNGKHQAVIVGVTSSLENLESDSHLFLNKEELIKAKEYLFEERRLSFLLGRYAAKEAICELVEIKDKTSVEIQKGVFEQPIVYYEGKEQIAVGIAHTGNYAVAISYMNDHPVGIDLEIIDAKNTDDIITQFTQLEKNLFDSFFSKDKKNLGATIFWTVKEAMAKCIKTGLMTPLTVFELDSIQKSDKGYVSTFTNFAQYKACSYLIDDAVLTIVMPKNSDIQYDSIEQFIFNLPN